MFWVHNAFLLRIVRFQLNVSVEGQTRLFGACPDETKRFTMGGNKLGKHA